MVALYMYQEKYGFCLLVWASRDQTFDCPIAHFPSLGDVNLCCSSFSRRSRPCKMLRVPCSIDRSGSCEHVSQQASYLDNNNLKKKSQCFLFSSTGDKTLLCSIKLLSIDANKTLSASQSHKVLATVRFALRASFYVLCSAAAEAIDK